MSGEFDAINAILGLGRGNTAAAIKFLRSGRAPSPELLAALADYLEKPPRKTRAKSALKAQQDENLAAVLRETIAEGGKERGSREAAIAELAEALNVSPETLKGRAYRPNRKRKKPA